MALAGIGAATAERLQRALEPDVVVGDVDLDALARGGRTDAACGTHHLDRDQCRVVAWSS